ncbi:MAG: hypothetical protein HOO86_03370 [Bacteroidales bacterium]|nr:hypothetical protein [Bacteroidales bacterium]
MNTREENQIDQILKQLKPIAAPEGFELKVMNQIAGLETETETTLLSRLHYYLLAVSMGAVAVAVFYLVGIDKIQLLLSSYTFMGSAWLQSEFHSLSHIANTLSHIPVLVLLIGAILAVLLILERIILRKNNQPSFVFLF